MKVEESQAGNKFHDSIFIQDLVSIIVACYNSEDFIAETLESLLVQSYNKIEVIIVNDFSTDSSLSILNSFALLDSRIKIFSNSSNLGPALSRNIGIQHSLGRYIAICDADDTWSSNKLEAQLLFINQYRVSIVGTSIKIVDSKGFFNRERCYKESLSENYQSFRPFPPHSSILFDRFTLPWCIYYDSFYQSAEDYKLLLDYSKKCQIMSIDDAFINYRIHSNNISKKKFSLFGQVGFSVLARVYFGLDDFLKNDLTIKLKIIQLINESEIESDYFSYQNFKSYLRLKSFQNFSFTNFFWLIMEKVFNRDPRLMLALKIISQIKNSKS